MDLLESVYSFYRNAINLTTNRRIITVSEHSKYSLIQYFPALAQESIEVLYSPMKLIPSELNENALQELGLVENHYALLVSASTWYKNAINAVVAYDMIFDSNYGFLPTNYKIVVVGGAKNADLQGIIRHQERFVLTDFLPTDTLEALYKYAHLFVFPSLNEGFGYPPLEAMKYGTICACAAGSSITEICRDMVLYFNPVMIGEICNRVLQGFDEKIRERLRIRMKKLDEVWDRQKRDLNRLVDVIAYGK